MRGEGLLFIASLVCAWTIPASHARQWGSPLRQETTEKQLRPLERRIDESICESLLRPHIQKVALMFLVRGDMYHEDVWTAWIGDLADLVPPSLFCDEILAQCYRDMPQRQAIPKSVYDQQVYFSIVVHTKQNYPGYNEGSIDNRIVQERVETAWGNHSLVTATRILMAAALEDPYNQQFQLVCEATIPVRAPLVTHDQLLAQNMSRIGYPGKMWGEVEGSSDRWPLAMHEKWPELRHHTKHHSQWVTLIREHIHIILNDTFLNDLFSRHCYVPAQRLKFWCINDEQYIGTLLSWKLGDHVIYEYIDDLAMAPVARRGGVPAEMLNADLLMQIRGSKADTSNLEHIHSHWGECHAVDKPSIYHVDTSDAERVALATDECARDPTLRQPLPYGEIPRFQYCAFFARKFQAATAPGVKTLLQGLYII
ncbi:hypothetical protein WJX75_000371 [Coccomyxa subellipsoidea]|uniref:Glycosyl transferase CAP10 domain-containing protein n=1 Tax=Coccomyxa subellipsoidea TaxID=248742 RepID=A0ABR2Z2W5_9CHLO